MRLAAVAQPISPAWKYLYSAVENALIKNIPRLVAKHQ